MYRCAVARVQAPNFITCLCIQCILDRAHLLTFLEVTVQRNTGQALAAASVKKLKAPLVIRCRTPLERHRLNPGIYLQHYFINVYPWSGVGELLDNSKP